MSMEAVVLAGGESRRMGRDKATLPIDGVPQAERIVRSLAGIGVPSTTLGGEPVPGATFLADAERFAGPVAALARFEPKADLVFVASCDLPRFDPALVNALRSRLGDHDAAVPLVDEWRQPLCGLYRASAFAHLPELVKEDIRCATKWLDRLSVRLVGAEELQAAGVDPAAALGANTPEELEAALKARREGAGMWDVSGKVETVRTARAQATLRVGSDTVRALREGNVPKGDPLPVARVAAVMAAKRTPDIVPYCHPLPIESVKVRFEIQEDSVVVEVETKTSAKTGVEMEALTAASVAALTLYDMLKQLDMGMAIESVRLLEKRGGKSDYERSA